MIFKKLILAISLIGFLHNIGIPSYSSADDKVEEMNQFYRGRVQAFVKNLNIIRVFFGNSPSMGHQANTHNLMLFLRSIGFQGQFEVIYDEGKVTYLQTGQEEPGTPQKLKQFFPEFDENTNTVQKIKSEKVVLIPSRLFEAQKENWPEVELGFTGGQDFHQMDAEKLKTLAYLDLYPSGFHGLHPELLFLSKPNTFANLYQQLGVGFSSFEVPILIEKNLKAVLSKLKKNNLVVDKLIDLLKDNNLDYMPVYGLKGYEKLGKGFAEKQFLNIVNSVQQVVEGHSKKTSIMILNQLTDEEKLSLKEKIAREYPTVAIVDLSQDTEKANSREIQDSKLTVHIVGSLPPQLFNYLLATSALPPVGGGVNFLHVMNQLEKSYLHTTSLLDVKNPPEEWVSSKVAGISILKEEWQNEVTKVNSAYGDLTTGKSNENLTEFLKNSLLVQSRQHQLFKVVKKSTPNKLLAAISYVIDNLVHFKHIEEPRVTEKREGNGNECPNLF